MKSGIRRRGRWLYLALAVLTLLPLLLTIPGCLMYAASEFMPEQDAEDLGKPTQSSAAQITLAWDPPAGSVVSYRVFFRIHGTAGWVQLADVPASPTPEYTVANATLGNGEFDFGVTAVYASQTSSMHSSLDASADPSTGWYLKWQR
jgi:hypothetical protein